MDLYEARRTARYYMDEHGLFDWEFRFNKRKTSVGICNYQHQRIELSEPLTLLNDESKIIKTILHEIAHALAGRGSGHGTKWQIICQSIGGTGRRVSGDVITPERNIIYKCDNCGREVKRYRRKEFACGKCCREFNGGKFTERFLFKEVQK
jgi:predicted SprT family Zn-dependent metalloprotease